MAHSLAWTLSFSLRKMAPITTCSANLRGNERHECYKFLCISVWAIKLHLCFIGAVKHGYVRIARNKMCAGGGGGEKGISGVNGGRRDSKIHTELNVTDSLMCRTFWVPLY